jgi:hypothetical protein
MKLFLAQEAFTFWEIYEVLRKIRIEKQTPNQNYTRYTISSLGTQKQFSLEFPAWYGIWNKSIQWRSLTSTVKRMWTAEVYFKTEYCLGFETRPCHRLWQPNQFNFSVSSFSSYGPEFLKIGHGCITSSRYPSAFEITFLLLSTV